MKSASGLLGVGTQEIDCGEGECCSRGGFFLNYQFTKTKRADLWIHNQEWSVSPTELHCRAELWSRQTVTRAEFLFLDTSLPFLFLRCTWTRTHSSYSPSNYWLVHPHFLFFSLQALFVVIQSGLHRVIYWQNLSQNPAWNQAVKTAESVNNSCRQYDFFM